MRDNGENKEKVPKYNTLCWVDFDSKVCNHNSLEKISNCVCIEWGKYDHNTILNILLTQYQK